MPDINTMAPLISLRDAGLILHNPIFHSNVITNLVWLMAAAVFEHTVCASEGMSSFQSKAKYKLQWPTPYCITELYHFWQGNSKGKFSVLYSEKANPLHFSDGTSQKLPIILTARDSTLHKCIMTF